MKKGTIIEQLNKSNDQEIKQLIQELLSFLDDFFYFYDLMNLTNYNDVFYYLYIESDTYSYIDIADFINKDYPMQIYRTYKKIEAFIEKIIDTEQKYQRLKVAITQIKQN